MKEQRSNEIKVGITVIVGVILLLLGFSIFKEWTLTGGNSRYAFRFPSSAGLQVGDPVSINGVKSGKVVDVALDGGEGVLVHAELEEGAVIAQGAYPTIQMLELMGGKKIEIRQGGGAPHDPSVELRGGVDPDIAGAFAVLGTLQTKVDTLATKAGTLLDNANAIVGDAEMVAAIKESVGHLRVISSDMRTLLGANRDEINEIATTLARVSRRTDTLLAELRPRLDRGLGSAERLAGRADTLLGDVQSLVGEIRDSRGLLHTVLHDTTFVRRFDNTLLRVDSVLNIIMDGQLKIRLRL